jgi:hypothetical protein
MSFSSMRNLKKLFVFAAHMKILGFKEVGD